MIPGPGTWPPDDTSFDAVTIRAVTADAQTAAAPYAALPAVSMPAGVAPASVPVPIGNTGVGLTAVDDGPIDLGGPLPAYQESPSPPEYPTSSSTSSYSPSVPSYPSQSPTASPAGWDVVVDDVVLGERGRPAAPVPPADRFATAGPSDTSVQVTAAGSSAPGGPVVTTGPLAARGAEVTVDPAVARDPSASSASAVTVGPVVGGAATVPPPLPPFGLEATRAAAPVAPLVAPSSPAGPSSSPAAAPSPDAPPAPAPASSASSDPMWPVVIQSAPVPASGAPLPAALPALLAELAAKAAAAAEAMGTVDDAVWGVSAGPATGPVLVQSFREVTGDPVGSAEPGVPGGPVTGSLPDQRSPGFLPDPGSLPDWRQGPSRIDGVDLGGQRSGRSAGRSAIWEVGREAREGRPSHGGAEHTAARRVPGQPSNGERGVSEEDLAARYVVVREQVDYALAEIALARAAFRRASEDDGPGWPFRDSELDVLRRPAVAHALARELAGVERLRVWAQELYWLQEQHRGFG
ncbi:hypothetical protein QOZ89_43000 [Pseudofrankia sp. BMG5.37]|nr:hypothetical protein [Pseudofrankia sp. BMG5.37]